MNQLTEKQHEESKKVGNELVDIKSETLHLSEDIKFLKEKTNKFSSKLVEHEKNLSKLPTLFEERIEKMSVRKTLAEKLKQRIQT